MNKNTVTKFLLKHSLIAASIFILFFSTGFNTNAQAPGYLGKRFTIGVELPMIVGYDLKKDNYRYMVENANGNYNKVNKDFFPLYFKVKPTVNIEFVLNRKSSIQAYARFFSSTIDVSPFYDSVGTNYQQFYPIDRAKAKTRSFGLKYKIFTGDGLCPVGKYISFGAEYALNTFDFQDNHFINNVGQGTQLMFRNPQSTVSRTLVLTFGFGTQYPLGKSLLFNLGGELGLPLSVFSSIEDYGLDPYSIFENPDTPTSLDWAKANSKNHFFRSYIFNITIGLALIP